MNGDNDQTTEKPVQKISEELRNEIKKQSINQVAKWIIAIFVLLVTVAGSGWWLYFKDKILPHAGGIPKGGVVAFTTPCPPGWKNYDKASGRAVIGAGRGKELSARVLGDEGGEEKTTLSESNIPSHQHDTVIGTQPHYSKWGQGPNKTSVFGAGDGVIGTGMTSFVGDGEPFENMQPFVVLQYCEKE